MRLAKTQTPEPTKNRISKRIRSLSVKPENEPANRSCRIFPDAWAQRSLNSLRVSTGLIAK